jgi:preprotein translocase subunit YajC
MFDLLPTLETFTAFLAQNGAPLIPGEAAPGTGAPGEPGTGATGRPAGGGFEWLLPMMLLFLAVIIIMSIMGQRKEKKRREQLIASVKKHDKVQTVGGVIGTVIELKPDTVVLKVDESSNTRITFHRSAIQQVIKSSTEKAAPAEQGLTAS